MKTEPMILWEFKCLDCGYRFKAIEPRGLYETYTECAICGSKNCQVLAIVGNNTSTFTPG